MAVFDGMGGESCGEMAAFLAAESCGLHYKEQKDRIRRDGEQFLLEACEKMNQAVCDYGTENRIDSMGTTAAMLAFGEDYDLWAAILGIAGYTEAAARNLDRFPRIIH